jgi:hypothetical protein
MSCPSLVTIPTELSTLITQKELFVISILYRKLSNYFNSEQEGEVLFRSRTRMECSGVPPPLSVYIMHVLYFSLLHIQSINFFVSLALFKLP